MRVSERSPRAAYGTGKLALKYAHTVTYLITFSCYGSHLHGEPSGSVDRHHNLYGSPGVDVDPALETAERTGMDQNPYSLGSDTT